MAGIISMVGIISVAVLGYKPIRLKLSRKTAYKDVLEAVNGIPLKN